MTLTKWPTVSEGLNIDKLPLSKDQGPFDVLGALPTPSTLGLLLIFGLVERTLLGVFFWHFRGVLLVKQGNR